VRRFVTKYFLVLISAVYVHGNRYTHVSIHVSILIVGAAFHDYVFLVSGESQNYVDFACVYTRICVYLFFLVDVYLYNDHVHLHVLLKVGEI